MLKTKKNMYNLLRMCELNSCYNLAVELVSRAFSWTHHQGRGHTPQGEYRHQTPHRPPQGGSRADLMPGEEGRCTSWPESSTV